MNLLKACVVIVAGIGLAALAFLYSGRYPMGADDHHTAAVHWVLETLRERSVTRSSQNIIVPALNDPQMLLTGGADYNDMCSGCHLKPGQTETDLSIGLYPNPPNLSLSFPLSDNAQVSAARQFWIIKHGIKASGMPAWGASHDDARIWAMVAFIQRMPSLTPEQYQILTARE